MKSYRKKKKKKYKTGLITSFLLLLDTEYSSSSEYVRFTQGSEQNAPLQIFYRVLNIPQDLKWQGYREL